MNKVTYRLLPVIALFFLGGFLFINQTYADSEFKYFEHNLSNNLVWKPSLYNAKINVNIQDISWKQDKQALGSSVVQLNNGNIKVFYSSEIKARGQRKSYIASRLSKDGGRTWSLEKREMNLMGARALVPSVLKTKNNDLHLFFIGMKRFEWEKGNPTNNNRSDLWTAVSQDNGKSWSKPKMIFKGYTGATNGAIQTSMGDIVVPFSHYVSNPGRLVARVAFSHNAGKTYHLGSVVDLGGKGDHSGAIEPTLLEISPNKILMLIRTTKGKFWKAYSGNTGKGWYNIGASRVLSAGAPGHILKLHDGRAFLAWNPNLKPQRPYSSKRRELLLNRKELWLSEIGFLDDDSLFLVNPFVLAKGKQVSYPSLYEDSEKNLYVSFHDVARSWKNTRIVLTKLPSEMLNK